MVGHVHHNAEALPNLASWARTGVEIPMYDSREQRDADITATAALPQEQLRELVTRSAAALARDLDALTWEDWKRQVVTATGRTVPATEIVWIRGREVGIHAVDLGTGACFEDMEEQLLEALVHDVVGLRLRRGEGATLAAWLTGRGIAGQELASWI